jgi:hypothetical protein
MSHVSIKTGSEGPRHDPYSFCELVVERPNGDSVMIHSGLGDWCHVTRWGKDNIVFATNGEQASRRMFETYVGCTPEVVLKAYRSLPYRRVKAHPCRPRQFIDVGGYAGESFTICTHCHEPVAYHFDLSAIE